MEFTCVLSVGGSLVYYLITKHSETVYTATLKEEPNKREDLPGVIRLEKTSEGWKAEPWQDEIVAGITRAIESAL